MKKIAILAILLLVLAGCKGNAEPMTLKLGLMPAVDAAPIYFALDNGWFVKENLTVEVTVFTNGAERQSALQSGEIDGTITDLIAVYSNVANGFPVKATSITDGSFPIIARPDFDMSQTEIKAAMMEVSITNFLADELLSGYTLEKVFVNEIPARIELLKSGQVDVAVLPEPVASQAEAGGLVRLDVGSTLSPDCIAFTEKALAEKDKAISTFYKGYNEAVSAMSGKSEDVKKMLAEKLTLPEAVAALTVLPEYQKASAPSREQVTRISDWVKTNLPPMKDVSYEDLIEEKYVK